VRYTEEARLAVVERYRPSAWHEPTERMRRVLERSLRIAVAEGASEITLDHVDRAEREAAA
jgi:hypothetical protein